MKINNYNIIEMDLKNINSDKIKNADIIIFPGGGLFGISYLDFAKYLGAITELADKKKIPVIFSSVGVNNMSYTDEHYDIIKNILERKCVKYISVRENLDFFKKFIPKSKNRNLELVCDPAVWTKYVYHLSKLNGKKKCVGINVVRGGLFKSNDKNWVMQDMFNYLNEVREILDNMNLDYKFYTNGSFLDDNAMQAYKEKYGIPNDKFLRVNTTNEFVNVVSSFDATICIRMHSSIVSYALDTPSINIIWNDKLKFFYENIGYKDRALELNDLSKELLETKISEIINDKKYKSDEKYLMSVYNFIYKVLSNISGSNQKCFNFNNVVNYLNKIDVSHDEDLLDLNFKIDKAEIRYLSLFNKDLEKAKRIKSLERTPLGLIIKVFRKLFKKN